jgi:hypothetical protein
MFQESSMSLKVEQHAPVHFAGSSENSAMSKWGRIPVTDVSNRVTLPNAPLPADIAVWPGVS